jgi:hypothetical protein
VWRYGELKTAGNEFGECLQNKSGSEKRTGLDASRYPECEIHASA